MTVLNKWKILQPFDLLALALLGTHTKKVYILHKDLQRGMHVNWSTVFNYKKIEKNEIPIKWGMSK